MVTTEWGDRVSRSSTGYYIQLNAAIHAQWVSNSTTWNITSNNIWNNWTTTSTGTSITWEIPERVIPEVSEEQAALIREAIRQERIQEQERDALRERAQERAEVLLLSLLSPDQREEWNDHHAFTEVLPSGAEYRIILGVAGNIHRYEGGVPTESLCCHPDQRVRDDDGRFLGELPREDVVVAQLLALRADEEGFRRTANITRHRRPRAADEAIAA